MLFHRWRDGERDSSQQATSYLQMISGSLGLYQSTLDPAYLDFAVELAEGARLLFYDEARGGFYLGTKRDDLVLRLKAGITEYSYPHSGFIRFTLPTFTSEQKIRGKKETFF